MRKPLLQPRPLPAPDAPPDRPRGTAADTQASQGAAWDRPYKGPRRFTGPAARCRYGGEGEQRGSQVPRPHQARPHPREPPQAVSAERVPGAQGRLPQREARSPAVRRRAPPANEGNDEVPPGGSLAQQDHIRVIQPPTRGDGQTGSRAGRPSQSRGGCSASPTRRPMSRCSCPACRPHALVLPPEEPAATAAAATAKAEARVTALPTGIGDGQPGVYQRQSPSTP